MKLESFIQVSLLLIYSPQKKKKKICFLKEELLYIFFLEEDYLKDTCNVYSDCCVLAKWFHLRHVVRWALFLLPPSEPRRHRQEAIALSEFPLVGGGTSPQPKTVSEDPLPIGHASTPYWRVSH